jgi:hypothetical protein
MTQRRAEGMGSRDHEGLSDPLGQFQRHPPFAPRAIR